jgi:hypothetical protein
MMERITPNQAAIVTVVEARAAVAVRHFQVFPFHQVEIRDAGDVDCLQGDSAAIIAVRIPEPPVYHTRQPLGRQRARDLHARGARRRYAECSGRV